MEAVGLRLAIVDMRRRNPFGVTVFEFVRGLAAGGDEAVTRSAGESYVVDVGAPAGGVVGAVVNFAQVARHVAIGKFAAAVFWVDEGVLELVELSGGIGLDQGFAIVPPGARSRQRRWQVGGASGLVECLESLSDVVAYEFAVGAAL